METNVVLVLLVGLPGSGKTKLCKALKALSEETENFGKLVLAHVCYDKLIPLSVQREFVEQKKSEEKSGKDHNRTDGENCEITVENESTKELKTMDEEKDFEGDGNEGQSISEDWKSARLKIHSQVDQLLHFINTRRTQSSVEDFFGIPFGALEGDMCVILLDDNFYYRSMRYEFYQLARRHSAAFCQLYMECSVEEAMQHNSMREESVPAEVVITMGARLQPPQPHLHPWEANTCVLQGQGEGQVRQAWSAVVQAFQHGLTPVEDREEEVAEARHRCSQSVVHQADLSLRAIVKHLIKKELQKASDGERDSLPASQVAARINSARQAVLADLREGVLEVLSCLADAITKDNRQEFDAFLEVEMKKKL